MIKIVGYLTVLVSFPVLALVPTEGLLMGEITNGQNTDPLALIFQDNYAGAGESEKAKIRLYQKSYLNGEGLKDSCQRLGPAVYSSPWQESQARRSIVSSLQYLGLDVSIKAIGTYAHKLNISESDYKQLSKNLVKNYCSKNITVFALKTIEQSLDYCYKNPLNSLLPSVENSPFATFDYKSKTESSDAKTNEFSESINNFRAFCSWGGEILDYRMLAPYLSNQFIMAFVFKNMTGMRDEVRNNKVITIPDMTSVQVMCEDLICRRADFQSFKKSFPLSNGSTGLDTDLAKQYCHHFRFQDYPTNTVPQVKKWIKDLELEDPIFETSFFISLLTGVPDAILGTNTYSEIPFLVKSSMDERWSKWAKDVLKTFSGNLLFEESLKVSPENPKDALNLKAFGFSLDFSVTLGELDRVLDEEDKITTSFKIKLSKNYMRSLRSKWAYLQKEIDIEGQQEFKEEMAKYINIQLQEKQKLFQQKMWTNDFSKIIANELLGQMIIYQGPLFDSYKDEILEIPTKFSYGVFALSYLKYRADVTDGKLKLSF